jgi:hypothetical protein
MVPKFVPVRGSYTRYYVIVYAYYNWGSFKKNGAIFRSCTEELRLAIWRPVYSNYGAAKSPGLGLLPSSILFRHTAL